jgi:hypothetical protein
MEEEFVVNQKEAEIIEQLGSKEKFWFKRNGRNYLYKEGRIGTGENWAEVIASDLYSIVNVPHADYKIARCEERQGVVTASFVPTGARLVHGNELLGKIYGRRNYDQAKQYKQTQYTLGRVIAVFRMLSHIEPPLEWETIEGVSSALDVFVGYLMMDAWIANQDRHHENWGVVVLPGGAIHLAPSFDHASSLGRNESDEKRKIRLETNDERQSMFAYVQKASTPFYYGENLNKKISTLEAFLSAAKYSKSAALAWLNMLSRISSGRLSVVFDRFPDEIISALSKRFAIKMLDLNRQRLLELRERLQ